jgi:CHAT domain-containing protein
MRLTIMRHMIRGLGDFAEREMLLDAAYHLARQTGSPLPQVTVLNEWSNARLASGDPAGALTKLQLALHVLGDRRNWPGYPTLLASIGKLYRAHGDHQRAMRMFEQVLDLHRRSGDRLSESMVLQLMGSTLILMKSPRKGIEYIENAVAVAQTSGAANEALLLRLGVLGAGYAELGEYARAIELLEGVERQAVRDPPLVVFWGLSTAYFHQARYVDALNSANRGLQQAGRTGEVRNLPLLLYWRARSLHHLGRTDAALEAALEALARVETIRGRLVPEDSLKRTFTNVYVRLVNLTVELLHRDGRYSEAFEVVERARARSFVDLLATQTAALQNDFETEEIRPSAGAELVGSDEPMLPSRTFDVAATVEHTASLARRLGSTVVSYWTTADAVYVWVVHRNGRVASARTRVAESHLNQLIGRAESRATKDTAAWRELYRLLVAPIASDLPKPGERLTILPSGPLFKLPFAALLDARGRYLVEDFVLHYAPAMAAFDLMHERRSKARRPPDRYLLAADPSRPPQLRNGQTLPSLAGSREEVEKIRVLLPDDAADLRTGARLRVEPIRNAARARSVLHFATHAVIDSMKPLDSFLAFSNGEKLTARDIYTMSLNADLVMLSACRSASGPISPEGVLGLTRAFLYAGAAAVIASPWDVPDEPTAVLVQEFYRQYRRTGRTDLALRAAQIHILRKLRAGEVQAKTPAGVVTLPEHPSLWAGFVLNGN